MFNLTSLKANVGQLDIDKLENVPTNLSNLECKVHVFTAKIKNIEDKIYDITNLGTSTTPNAKKVVLKTTTTALTAAENKKPKVIILVKKLTIT